MNNRLNERSANLAMAETAAARHAFGLHARAPHRYTKPGLDWVGMGRTIVVGAAAVCLFAIAFIR